MSVRELLQAAVVATLGDTVDVAVFDAPPVRHPVAHALVDEPVLIDWSTKDMAGREGRIAVTIHDAGERPVRLRALSFLVEEAVEAMDPVLGEGWRIVTLRMVRSRIVASRGGGWTATSEFQVRMLREN